MSNKYFLYEPFEMSGRATIETKDEIIPLDKAVEMLNSYDDLEQENQELREYVNRLEVGYEQVYGLIKQFDNNWRSDTSLLNVYSVVVSGIVKKGRDDD